jgi:type II secretory pathway component PulC
MNPTHTTKCKRRLFSAALFVLLAPACAHQSPAEQGINEPLDPGGSEVATAVVPGAPVAMDKPDQCASLVAPGKVKRSAIVDVVDRGLGVWLQGVSVKADVRNGKFNGWRIQSLHLTNPCYANVDLQPGDIVTAVNGSNVAREGKAFEVFTALKTAPAIEVEYLREGKTNRLRFTIAD